MTNFHRGVALSGYLRKSVFFCLRDWGREHGTGLQSLLLLFHPSTMADPMLYILAVIRQPPRLAPDNTNAPTSAVEAPESRGAERSREERNRRERIGAER